EILGYPEDVFPPTDFHSATLVGDYLYIIGSLGYYDRRKPGETPVFRLDSRTFQIEPVPTSGKKPGWISRHKAWYEHEADRICVSGGQRLVGQKLVKNRSLYALNLQNSTWVRLT
ncbi:MAG: ankyrin repeat domain-containing protein, partial [Solirubrobacteraceae bacterium]